MFNQIRVRAAVKQNGLEGGEVILFKYDAAHFQTVFLRKAFIVFCARLFHMKRDRNSFVKNEKIL